MKAIGYIRVSTEDQAKNGVSLEAQAASIQRYAEFKKFELFDVIEDAGISGGINKGRDGFIKLLDIVESGEVQAVILYSLERLSRDMLTLLDLERLVHECDVEIHTVDGALDTSTPTGFMDFAMRAFLGEMERRQIKYRTKKALEHKRNTDKVFNHEPYGYRREGSELVPVISEQAVIRQINSMYEIGQTVAAIATHLNEQGIATKQGKDWTSTGIKRLLENHRPTYQKRASRTVTAARALIMAIG